MHAHKLVWVLTSPSSSQLREFCLLRTGSASLGRPISPVPAPLAPCASSAAELAALPAHALNSSSSCTLSLS